MALWIVIVLWLRLGLKVIFEVLKQSNFLSNRLGEFTQSMCMRNILLMLISFNIIKLSILRFKYNL